MFLKSKDFTTKFYKLVINFPLFSRQEYNQHIQDLKEEMQEATKAAELIRKDIQTFRSR